MKLQELTQLALLGTERQVPKAAAATGGPLDGLVAQIDPAQRERFVLSTAALVLQRERAGTLALRDPRPLPEPCPTEERQRASSGAGSMLLSLIGGERADLIPEWLNLAARGQLLAPPETLPPLLALGAAKPDLRELILPVLGARGAWLATQNSDWNWTAGAAAEEGVWQTGEPQARTVFLHRLRNTNPSLARELLLSTWKEDAPDDRAAFIKAMSSGLGPEDEPFLETALDDKRKEVRRAAVDFLARLPNSAFLGRMKERTTPLLKFTASEPGKVLRLKKARKAAIEVTLPTACDKAMQRDGIEPKPPSGIGEKAWWLVQMLELVPLATWTKSWNSGIEEILDASLDGEWKKEFFEAWTRAAIRQQNSEWADALLPVAMELKRFDKPAALLAALSPERREARLLELLKADDPKARQIHDVLLLQCRHGWSQGFSRAVLAWLRSLTSEQSVDWSLRNQLKEFARFLSPETLQEAATGWPMTAKGWEFWSSGVDGLIATAQFRHDMREALKSKT